MELQLGQRILYGKYIGTVRWLGEVESTVMIGIKSREVHGNGLTPRADVETESATATNLNVQSDATADTTTGASPNSSVQDDGNSPESASEAQGGMDPLPKRVVGIEWDNWRIGLHDGMGYFVAQRPLALQDCISQLETAYKNVGESLLRKIRQDHVAAMIDNYTKLCSFILPQDLSLGISLEQAIFDRYVNQEIEGEDADADADADAEAGAVEGDASAKEVVGEFVGKEQALDFFRDTENLYMLGLSNCNISHLGDCSKFKFKRLRHVHVDHNLFFKWDTLDELLKLFPRLDTLDVSGNLFCSPVPNSLSFVTLSTLCLNKCSISLEDGFSVACQSSTLTHLGLANNGIIKCKNPTLPIIENLHVLDLSGNFLYNWHCILKILRAVPNLEHLTLSNNRLGEIVRNEGGNDLDFLEAATCVDTCKGLRRLYLDDNVISSWSMVGKLALVFSNLEHLRLVIYGSCASLVKIHRQVLIAIFPRLVTLNGTQITSCNRTNAERYYMSLEASNAPMFKETNLVCDGISHLQRLEAIHGEHASARAAKDASANKDHDERRLIALKLIPDADAESFTRKAVMRRFFTSASVADVKSVCSRLFGLNLHNLQLAYNDGKMPLCEVMDDEDATLSHYGIDENYNIRVQLKHQ